MAKLTLEKVLEVTRQLPAKDKLRLISRLAEDLATQARANKRRRPITAYSFCGMWEDRQGMEDSTAWVRRLREQEEKRSFRG